MSGQELFLALQEKTHYLDKALNLLGKRGRAYAQANHDYRVALSKTMLAERENGTPATILSDVCRGREEIAKLAFERDVAEAIYRAAMEAVNVYKLEIRLLGEQIDREWNRS